MWKVISFAALSILNCGLSLADEKIGLETILVRLIDQVEADPELKASFLLFDSKIQKKRVGVQVFETPDSLTLRLSADHVIRPAVIQPSWQKYEVLGRPLNIEVLTVQKRIPAKTEIVVDWKVTSPRSTTAGRERRSDYNYKVEKPGYRSYQWGHSYSYSTDTRTNGNGPVITPVLPKHLEAPVIQARRLPPNAYVFFFETKNERARFYERFERDIDVALPFAQTNDLVITAQGLVKPTAGTFADNGLYYAVMRRSSR